MVQGILGLEQGNLSALAGNAHGTRLAGQEVFNNAERLWTMSFDYGARRS
jgi:hypothetical protein